MTNETDIHSAPPPTYAQVAASPPKTPRSNAKPHPQETTRNTTAGDTQRAPKRVESEMRPTSGLANSNAKSRTKDNVEATQPPPPLNRSQETASNPPQPCETNGEDSGGSASLARGVTPSTVYNFDDLDMEAFEDTFREPERRYETPTSEDWRNLSVHGESVASDDLGGAIATTVGYDKVDLENFVTNGIDRFGNTIPGQESQREEYQSRKRLRAGSPVDDTNPQRVHSVRFRKYRAKVQATPRRPSDQGSHDAGRTGQTQAPKPTSGTLTVGQLSPTPRDSSSLGLSTTNKGKAPDRGRDRAPIESDRTPTPYPPRTPWCAQIMEIDMDTMDEEQEHAGYTWPPSTPTPLGSGGPRGLTPMDRNANQTENENVAANQVEVLPSFLAPPPATQAERFGSTRPSAEDGASPHIPPPNPGADGYGFTPEPQGGFPIIHQAHPEGLIEDLAISRIDEAWKQSDGTVLLVQVANMGHPDVPLRKPMHDEIYGVISRVTGKTDFVPIAPQPEWVQPPRRSGSPKTWMVFGLQSEDVTELVRLKVLSCAWITLFFYERRLVIPKYLFTLTGYTTNHEDDIVNSIKGAFRDDPIFSTIADLVLSHPGLQQLGQHEAALRITDSVEVRIDRLGNGNMQAAVFCDSPTGCGESWKLWRNDLMKMPFHSRFNPTAVARRIELCQCCHSADHVTHKCPFPLIPGWNAPPPLSRTYGKPRQLTTGANDQTRYPPPPSYQSGTRGRGRSGPQRGGRNATPQRSFTYAGQ